MLQLLVLILTVLGVLAVLSMGMYLGAITGALAFGIVVVGITLIVILNRRSRMWLLQGQVESGPYSRNELGRMQLTNQLHCDDRVRWANSEEWRPFTVKVHPAPRLRSGFVGLIFGGFVGFGVAFGVFGQVPGANIRIEHLFEKPTKSAPRTYGEGALRIGAAGAKQSFIPGVSELGGAAAEGFKMYDENSVHAEMLRAIDTMRLVIFGSAVFFALLFAVGAKPRFDVILGRIVTPPPAERPEPTPPRKPEVKGPKLPKTPAIPVVKTSDAVPRKRPPLPLPRRNDGVG